MVVGSTLEKKVIDFLAKDPYMQYNRKTLSMILSINNGSLGKILRRLADKNLVLSPQRGFYQHPKGLVREELDLLIRFHGIKVETNCHKYKGWPYLRLHEIVTGRFAHPELRRHPVNQGITTYSDWDLRLLTITLHKEELEVFCQSSNYPLSLLDLMNYFSFLYGAFGISEEAWKVAQCDYNIDEVGKINLPLTDISISNFKGLILKFYEKKIGLIRTEVRSFEKMDADKLINNARVILKTMESLKS